MKKNIIIVYSTHLKEIEDYAFEQNIKETIGVDYTIHRKENKNQYSLPEVYNEAINKYASDDSIMVFCHNDIIFKTKDWGKKLLAKFNNNFDFQIIGVAGSTYMPDTGKWWERRGTMVGIVEHTNGLREWVSEYSPPFKGVRTVVLIDGLFMAVNTSEIEHKFDEDFKGFHFYDLPFCISNYLDGCNIGVISDIRILHKSIGMTNDQWEANRVQFVEKYKEELPIELE